MSNTTQLLEFPTVEQVRAQKLNSVHPYAYYMMTGYSDFRPIMIKCGIAYRWDDSLHVSTSLFCDDSSYHSVLNMTAIGDNFKLTPVNL